MRHRKASVQEAKLPRFNPPERQINDQIWLCPALQSANRSPALSCHSFLSQRRKLPEGPQLNLETILEVWIWRVPALFNVFEIIERKIAFKFYEQTWAMKSKLWHWPKKYHLMYQEWKSLVGNVSKPETNRALLELLRILVLSVFTLYKSLHSSGNLRVTRNMTHDTWLTVYRYDKQ